MNGVTLAGGPKQPLDEGQTALQRLGDLGVGRDDCRQIRPVTGLQIGQKHIRDSFDLAFGIGQLR